MVEQGFLAEAADLAVRAARKRGADAAEAYILEAKELTIEVADGAVETLKLAEDRGLGLRLFRDGKLGFSYSSSLEAQAIDEAVSQALANSVWTGQDPYNIMPKGGQAYPQIDVYDPKIREAVVEDKIKLAKEIEELARAYDSRIKITETSAYSDSEYTVTICNSEGLQAAYRGAYCAAYAFLVAEENGDNQTGFGFQYSLCYQDLNKEAIAKEAAQKAVQMLGARTITSQKAAIVLDPRVAAGFLGLLATALSADSVQKGKSLLEGKVGSQVASSAVTVIDNGRLAGGIMSAPFDGEGVPTEETELIKEGNLCGYLHNTYTAAKAGTVSTGNGTRGSFKGTPDVGVTNFYVQPGTTPRDQIIKDVSKGLYITEVMGMHTANPISGDFSVGVGGIWIENGEPLFPVRGATAAGNILDLWSQVEVVGNDLRFMGSKGAPTIRIAGMMLSGG